MRAPRGLELVRDLRHAVENRAGLGRRSTHVEREETRRADAAPERRRRDRAARRPALDDRRGPRGDALRGRHAAVAAHHVERRVDAVLAQLAHEPLEVRLDDRRERGVDDGGRKALVLAILRIDLGRTRDSRLGQRGGDCVRHAALVRVVRIRVQQTDRDRCDASAAQLVAGCGDGRLVERFDDVPEMIHSFADGQPVVARNQRMRTLDEQIVNLAAVLTADLDDVAEAVRRDERGTRQLETELAEQRVGRDRRRVGEKLHRRPRLVLAQQPEQGLHHRAVRLARRARDLARDDAPAPRLRSDEVGERAADVDPYAQRAPLRHGRGLRQAILVVLAALAAFWRSAPAVASVAQSLRIRGTS